MSRSTVMRLVGGFLSAFMPITADVVAAGRRLLFDQQPFVQLYRQYVVGGVVVLMLQLTLIVGLLVERVRRRRAEQVSRNRETRYRSAEDALGDLEARNSAMLRAIPDLMFVLRRDGTYVDYHAKDSSQLFAPPSVFIGKKVRDIMPPDLVDGFMDAIERAFQNDATIAVEYSLPMGEARYFEMRLARAGEDRVLSMVREVTEAKRQAALNRDLAGRLIESQEAERQRIARELHDGLGQKIALLAIDIDRLAGTSAARSRAFRELHDRANEIATDVHNMSHQLHPSKLQTLGLRDAIQSLCRDVSRHNGVTVHFTHRAIPTTVDPAVSLCLYRIVQEALHNVARHSRAREAQVTLVRDNDCLALQIADTGVGFNPNAQHAGLGLVSMRERISLLRGQLVIHTFAGGGTRIGVRVPLEPQAADATLRIPHSA